MSKTPIPFYTGDVSALAKSLRKQLDEFEQTPSHVEMLNLLAKAGGFRNFQHFKSQQDANASLLEPKQKPAPEINFKRVKKALGYFDLEGRLVTWPKKHSLRSLCMWGIWSRIPARTSMSELEIDELLMLGHQFCDHALLRRWLIEYEMVERTPDGSSYKRLETQPPAEAIELLKALRQ